MRTMVVLLVLLAVAAATLAGCGDLAELSGGGSGFFNDTSASFHMEAGDTVDIAYSVDGGGDGIWAVSIAINGVSSGTSDSIVDATSEETSMVSLTCQETGDYQLSAAGKNGVYSVTVSKE